MSKKPYMKATTEGRLYIDTSDPEFKRWFITTVTKLSQAKLTRDIRERQMVTYPWS